VLSGFTAHISDTAQLKPHLVPIKKGIVMSKIYRGLGAATLLLALSTMAYAAAPSQVIHVSLLGEADQPMSVKLDVTTIKAGAAEFDVSNDAVGTDHEVILVKLTSKDQAISADPKKHRINEAKLKTMGEVGGLKPGDKGVLKATLKPGEYALICNHKSHYELGMATRFTVTK
jgi:uncharacterized cupredoxin-like copper-binding protein